MFAPGSSVLALLLPLAVAFGAGCDQRSIGDEVEEGSDVEMEMEEPELESHEGEACDSKVGQVQACSNGKVDGLEICVEDPDTYEVVWSGCYVDTCDEVDATQECKVGEETGVQHCFEAPSEDKLWGACVVEEMCKVGEIQDCGFGEEMPFEMSCFINDLGEAQWNWWACNTPLVLSFDGRAPAFAAAPAAAKAFDITGAGACVDPDWPSAATPWLALDRDHNGSIDGGHELFGNGTRMAAGGRATQGFEALSDLDSDSDGRISPADAIWSELVLWADHDGDRRSSGWELLSLESYGVEAIELDYRSEVVCDGRGNCGAERAAFTFRDGGQARTGEVIDVYLACGE